ncbi:MAG: sodium:proton antiporter [Calditrichaeota bacterium]|nr:sodium:proton antiporter [Calditrichota bacterium]
MNILSPGQKWLFAGILTILTAFIWTSSAEAQATVTPPSQSAAVTHTTSPSSHSSAIEMEAEEEAKHLPLYAALPFVGILLSVALFPLLFPHFWHHHYPKVAAFWALVFAVPFLIHNFHLALYEILHIVLIDYIPFIILLWGLFTVSGGILLRGTLVGTPALNVQMLAIGTLLASWMGTTGASMLLIRPVLRANAERKSKAHVIIFFIFLVSNIGGALTPLGDPPLFLGFLHGVPFFWTLHITPHFLVASVLTLLLFFLIDSIIYKKEDSAPKEKIELAQKYPLRLEGMHNFLFLGGILISVLMSGAWRPGVAFNLLGIHLELQNLCRDAGILLMCFFSWKTTHIKVRQDNQFTWGPIKEVAYLFIGIFITIIPLLMMLRAGESGSMGFIIRAVKEPAHYFWITGILSSFLDNAPTYLTFFNTALGRLGMTEGEMAYMLRGVVEHPEHQVFIEYLKGISAGAVFFGANTYIGNAPNFMVRSIAEEAGVKMPSFFGYMLWSVGILVPIFVVITLIFF